MPLPLSQSKAFSSLLYETRRTYQCVVSRKAFPTDTPAMVLQEMVLNGDWALVVELSPCLLSTLINVYVRIRKDMKKAWDAVSVTRPTS